MSGSSRKDSNSSQKSIIGRISLSKKSTSDTAGALKKSLGHVTDMTKNVGSSLQNIIGRKESNVFSKGVRELDDYGYEKYNISDESEIFISKVPEKALFNDGEPVLVRATSGNFVGPAEINTKAQIQVETAPIATPDAGALFSNVSRGTASEREVEGFVGSVVDGRVEYNRSFLEKMPKVQYGSRQSHEEVPAEVEMPVEDVVEEVAAPETVCVPETIGFEEADADEDVFIMEVPEAPVEDVVEAEADAETDVISESFVEAVEETFEPVEAELEEEVIVEAVPFVEPVMESATEDDDTASRKHEEFFIDDISEDVADADVETDDDEDDMDWLFSGEDESDVCECEDVSAIEEVVADASEDVVEETIIATPSLVKIDIEENVQAPIEGLYVEGSKASDDAVETTEAATIVQAETAETCSGAVKMPVTNEPVMRIKGMDEEGADFLPPLSDPVIRRPRGVRFRFNNGVLQSVDETSAEKSEPEEELRVPFDVTVDEAVSPAADATPVTEISDEVADIMRLTVPELDIEDFAVESSYDDIPYDGMEEIVCRMDASRAMASVTTEEVVEIMLTATESYPDDIFADADLPAMICSAKEIPALPSANNACIAIAASNPVLALPEYIPSEAEAEEAVSGVTFSFGIQASAESESKVCFSF